MTARILTASVFALLVAGAADAQAQAVRVNPRDYPAGFFDPITPGAPVEGKPGWVWQHDGFGWLQAEAAPPTPPTFRTFKLGRSYQRDTGSPDGLTRLFIAGAGQLPDGAPVIFALCRAGCAGLATVRMLPLVHAQDWEELPIAEAAQP